MDKVYLALNLHNLFRICSDYDRVDNANWVFIYDGVRRETWQRLHRQIIMNVRDEVKS